MVEIFRLLSVRIWEFLKKIPRHVILPVIALIFGLIFFGIGLIQYIFNSGNRENMQNGNFTKLRSISQVQNTDFTPSSGLNRDSEITPQLKMISVDVEGAVENPGVYSVSPSSKLQDGLIASGGLAANADRMWIGKNLNLAQDITPGMKIYIPELGEPSPYQSDMQVAGAETTNALSQPTPKPANPDSIGAKKKRRTSVKKTKTKKQKSSGALQYAPTVVSINNASVEDLSALPGVKAATAKKIISRRPYASLDDLLKKKAVSKRTFAKIKDRITL